MSNSIEDQISDIYNGAFEKGVDSSYDSIKKIFIQIASDYNKSSFDLQEIINTLDTSKAIYLEMIQMRIKASKEGL